MKRVRWRAPLARVGLAVTGLAVAAPVAAAPVGPDTARTRHVVVVSVDGLRPDAIEAFGLSTLRRLMREGSHALDATTIPLSRTLPSHASMLTGVGPERHGITWNRRMEDGAVVRVPTIFELARRAGLRTAAFYSKAKLRHLDRPGSLDHRAAPASNADNWMATRTIPEAIQYLRHERPNLLFVHIGEPDYAGHVAGWMSFFYRMAARRADAGVARLLEAAEETYGAGNFTLIVTADHGGHDRGHGSEDPRDTAIPWIAYGQAVRPDVRLRGVRTTDTAATALWLLGVAVPAGFQGAPVHEAFRGGPVLADDGR